LFTIRLALPLLKEGTHLFVKKDEDLFRPLTDAHIHIFPPKLMEAVFSFFQKQYGWKLPFPTDPDKLANLLQEQGVEKAFTLAYAHKPGLSRSINHWLAGYCRTNPWLVPFGAVHPLDSTPEQVAIECFDRYNFAGMKLHCLVQQCRPDDEKLYPLYETIADRSKGIIIHAGSFPQPDNRYLGVCYVENLLRRYPTLNLVIPHLGLNDLQAYSGLLDQYDNLFLDTAFIFQNEIVSLPLKGIVDVMLAHPDRIIYGSDFPLILEPPGNGIERILGLGLPQYIYKNLFSGNAARFLAGIAE
jgi:uncharacterized protein